MLEITNKDFCKRKIKEVLILHNSLKYLNFKKYIIEFISVKTTLENLFVCYFLLSKTFL